MPTPSPTSQGLPTAPIDAARRQFRRPTKKTAGLSLRRVARIMGLLGHEKTGHADDHQRKLAFSATAAIGFKPLLRFEDLGRCRWDEGSCDESPIHVPLYLSHRKNHQNRGQFLDIACPADPSVRGVYHSCVLGRQLFNTRPMLSLRGYLSRNHNPKLHSDRLALY